eukprot:2426116-Pyramimonas_sp.AAC.1
MSAAAPGCHVHSGGNQVFAIFKRRPDAWAKSSTRLSSCDHALGTSPPIMARSPAKVQRSRRPATASSL